MTIWMSKVIMAFVLAALLLTSVPVTSTWAASTQTAGCNGGTNVTKHWWGVRIYLDSCLAERVASDAENIGIFAELGNVVGVAIPPAAIIGSVTSVVNLTISKRIRDANRNGQGVVISQPWPLLGDPLAWGIKSQVPSVVAQPPQPAVCPYAWGRNLAYGSRGADVQELQRRLHIQADGQFGPITKQAVRNFQQSHGLADDGIVGPYTQAELNKICR